MSVLQQCNEESAKIFAPMARRIARERQITLEKIPSPAKKTSFEIRSEERFFRVEAMRQNVEMDDSDETALGFSQFEPFHFQRNAAFLEMLQLTAKNDLDPLTPEIFNKCFEVSAT
jgi:hypothetical protein